ncbi:MAG: opine dehydrogenase [Thermotogaceae bacterium]|jgi:opine dehydrogenase|nr:opine dehydrogenase [Thermotogaceae bacterium]MDN5337751.1 opine dehydrogenase [Thermotogaceae bacterium]
MKICVIGAGNGGQALAGYLAVRGFDVSLYNRSYWRIAPIIKNKIIRLEGEVNKIAKLSLVTTDLKEAVEGRELIMVVVPASAHREIAKNIAPYLEDGQIIILNPGRTYGALEFSLILKNSGIKKDVIIAETQTFVFASRTSNPGVVRIFRIKNAVPVSALPATKNEILREVVEEVMPEFIVDRTILYTSFNNIGAVFHPATLILNAARIEATFGKFEFYLEGITQSVARVLEAIDRERCEVAKRLDVEPITAVQWLNYAYDVYGTNLYDAIHNNQGYQGIMAPPSLQNRYIFEDVPMSLVPISSTGKHFGIPTPTIDSIIQLASVMMGRDFYTEGRTLERLGLKNISVDGLRKIVEEGGDAI